MIDQIVPVGPGLASEPAATAPLTEEADMSSATLTSHRPSDKPKTILAGIDLSSWLSWASYSVGFGLALRLAPGMAEDLTSGGIGLAIVASAVVSFFVIILLIQQQMNVSLRNTSFGAPKKLVDGGVFAHSRNPMYVAFLLPLVSIAYYSPTAALAAVALYIVSMNSLVISVEEETLEASFGNSFRRYCLATPRWIIW